MWLPRDSTQSESRIKSKLGVISSSLEDTTPLSAAVSVAKTVKPYVDMFRTIASTAVNVGRAAAVFGLSKPTTVETTKTVLIDPVPNFTNGRGLDYSKKFSMDPEAGIATDVVAGGIEQDEMDLKYVVGTPALTSSFAMVNGTPATIVGSTSPFALMSQYTFVDYVTRLFQYVSGSYKFRAYITASTMHSVRLVFYLALDAASDYQSCYHRIVDVQGDTDFEFTIPYCVTPMSRDILNESSYFGVYVEILSWSQPVPAVSAPIYINVYKAGDSDFRFYCAKDMDFQPTSNPRKDFAKTFQPLHPSMTGYDPGKLIYAEEYSSMRELMHRMYPYYQVTNAWTSLWQGNTSDIVGKELYALLYMFHRGSTRFKYLRKSSASNTEPYVTGVFAKRLSGSTSVRIPGFDMCVANKPVLEGEIPWYSNLLYDGTGPSQISDFQVICAGSTPAYFCTAAGDDVTCMFLVGPPPGVLVDTSGGLGYPGLQVFYSY